MRTAWIWFPLLLAALGCDPPVEAPAGRMALALTGQFFPGELTTLDLFIYDGAEVECSPADGTLSTQPVTALESLTGIDPGAPREITFDLPPDASYVVAVTAGRGSRSNYVLVARGCATVSISEDQEQAQVSVELRRIDVCGNGTLDPLEMCDDGGREDDDGCDSGCRTEPAWVNDVTDFREGEQQLPIAASDSDLIALCWRSDFLRSQRVPMAWFDSSGGEGEPFLGQTDGETRRDCSSVDVRGDLVLLSFSLGTGLPETTSNFLTAWRERNSLPPVVIGDRTDPVMRAAFYDDEAVITIAETSGGVQLRSVLVGSDALDLDDTAIPVDSETTGQSAARVAGGDGSFVVAWETDTGQVWARLWDGLGAPAEAQNLCPGASHCSSPSVASLRGDVARPYLVVFLGTDDQVMGSFIDSEGLASEQFPISTELGCREPVAAGSNAELGEFLVAWTQPVDEGSESPAHIWARLVTGIERFGLLAAGDDLTDEPFRVTAHGSDYDQPAIGTAIGTADPSTALVFYHDLGGISGATGSDLGFRLLRVGRIP